MASTTTTSLSKSSWFGGNRPYKASYGKLMMWFFLMSDAFTFATLLVVYGVVRFSSDVPWADPEKVFTHFPMLTEWFQIHPPLAFVGLMTFILIASSVTMVLAVEAGHRMDQRAVERFMLWTIAGGVAFLSCQAYEWYNFINGTELGGFIFADGTTGQFVNHGHGWMFEWLNSLNGAELPEPITANAFFEGVKEGVFQGVPVKGAGLEVNQYCANPDFANLFFFITGFHGTHVASGVFINFVIYKQVQNGVMHRRGHYEMVEKVGLYWHFVDLVWVFVFTFFYLV